MNVNITSNPSLIETSKFFDFRRQVYAECFDVIINHSDAWDSCSTQFVARAEGDIVGGVRLVISQEDKPLPMEAAGINLSGLFHLTPTGQYAEVSRLVTHPSYRQGAITDSLCVWRS